MLPAALLFAALSAPTVAAPSPAPAAPPLTPVVTMAAPHAVLLRAPDDEAKPVFTLTPVPYAAGEAFDVETVLEIKLEATIGVGFLAQTINYDLREQERLGVRVQAPEKGEQARREFSYTQREATSIAPIVGKKTKQRRVHGKSYVIIAKGDDRIVNDASGTVVREKEAKYVRATFLALGGVQPALFSCLPDEGETALTVGQTIEVGSEAAKRLLGLPLDQLEIESLTLTVTGAGPDGTLDLNAEATLGGEAEIGERALSLEGSLAGPIIIDPATARVSRMELTGSASIVSESEESMLSGSGQGDIVLRKMVRARKD